MYKERTLKNIYSACLEEGSLVPLLEIDLDQIKSMVNLALIDLSSAQEWKKKASKESGQWNAIFKIHYDVLHSLIEAFVHFDKLKLKTHECLFAYLCDKHPELDFDWNFFEKIRTKRNRSSYYGEPVKYKDWAEVDLQINLYINTIKKAIDEELKK